MDLHDHVISNNTHLVLAMPPVMLYDHSTRAYTAPEGQYSRLDITDKLTGALISAPLRHSLERSCADYGRPIK